MGYNSVIMVLNDRFSEIENNSEHFVREMRNGIATVSRKGPVDIRVGQSQVVSCAHADQTQLVAVGGNHSTLLGTFQGDHHTPEAQEQILRAWADKLGYTLRKKPAKRTK